MRPACTVYSNSGSKTERILAKHDLCKVPTNKSWLIMLQSISGSPENRQRDLYAKDGVAYSMLW